MVYLDSNKDIFEKGEDIEIFVKSDSVIAFNLNLYYDNTKLEYISGPENTNAVENRIIYAWYDETGGNSPKNGQIAKFVFRAKENGTATFSVDGDFYNNEHQLMQMDFKGTSVQIGNTENIKNTSLENMNIINLDNNAVLRSNNTKLEILAIEDILLNPPFDANINKYSIEISENIEKLNIFAVPENENAKIKIIGNEELKIGNNLIKIEVTAQNGITKSSYEINAYKRNEAEEQLYEKSQEENTKKLEQIYKVQRTNSEIEMPEDMMNTTHNIRKSSNVSTIILVSMFIVLIFGIVIFKYKKSN